MKIILGFIVVLLALYFLFVLTLYLYQNKLVYLPPVLSEDELKPLATYKNLKVQTEDGLTLKAYYLAPEEGKPLIVVFHGNASHPVWKIAKFKEWAAEGYGFLLAEYRGYGGNPGLPTEAGLYKDGRAYMNWIAANTDLKNNPVVVYGESLGSGVAVDMAANNARVSAVILEVTFNALNEVGAWHYPYIPLLKHIMKNKFPNEEKIKNIHTPILFLLAGKDEVVPVQFGKKLAFTANEPKEIHIFENSTHNNVYEHGAGVVVKNFLTRNFP